MPHWTHSRIDFASRPFSYRFWNKAARPTIAYCRPSTPLGKQADGQTARKDKARQVVAGAGKNILDYVTRRFNASSAGLKSSWGWTFAGTPLSAISRSN